MNLIKFLNNLSDPELMNKPISRRNSLHGLKKTAKDMALVSIPFAFAATGKKTAAATMAMPYAQEMATPTEVLQFALTLEYLERDFYAMALEKGVIPTQDISVFELIHFHEQEHVEFLIKALGDDAFDAPEFDFSAGLGLEPFVDYPTFLALSQGFEDTGVRAYKGQAGALIDDNTLLEYALQIHSIEARHASKVRRLRSDRTGLAIKGWIVGDGDQSFLPPAFNDRIYAREGNTEQLGIQLAGRFDQYPLITTANVTEAFDEPLTMAEVLAIAGFFLK